MRERRLKVEGQSERAAEGVGMPQVRVKVEEDTPRMPAKTKRKGQEREVERGNEPGGSRLGAITPNPTNVIDVSTPHRPPRRRLYSREEQHALRTGTVTVESLEEVYENGRRDFALQCAPSQPADRSLTAEEDAEYLKLWETLLHLDRVFSGSLRDVEGLQKRADELMVAAALRVHGGYPVQGPRVAPPQPTAGGSRSNAQPINPIPDEAWGWTQSNERAATSCPQAARRNAVVDLISGPDDDDAAHPDEFVESVRQALRPLHSAMLARAKETPEATRAARHPPSRVRPLAEAKEREKEWPPVRVHTRVKENAVKGNMSKNGVRRAGSGGCVGDEGKGDHGGGSSHENSTATKRGDSAAVGSKRARDPEVEDVPAKRTRRGNAQGEPSTPARITRSRSAQVEGARATAALKLPPTPSRKPTRSKTAQGSASADPVTTGPVVTVDVPRGHKPKFTYKPEGEGYIAWIPDAANVHSNDSASNGQNQSADGLLTPNERAWLSAQDDLARADYWRPVRWLDLGARMHRAHVALPQQLKTKMRPLHHGWRFPGHEHVGQVGVPWAAWVQSDEGRRWIGGN
ncbi:hypothetical protein B0H13DRAFT_1994392 [Mycena leptocephala]|nr:hypothetical protein B0H13DRAFT_1994392 [Mycena leptocephala]